MKYELTETEKKFIEALEYLMSGYDMTIINSSLRSYEYYFKGNDILLDMESIWGYIVRKKS